MKKFQSLLKGHKYICFLDFEGTQFSHEMIAIGAVTVSLDKKGNIKHYKEPFYILVKPKNKIGKFVTNLTGITEEMLTKDAVSFPKALTSLRHYCGSTYKKCSFVTFGNHDLRILNQSIAYNLDTKKEDCTQIQKNYIDFSQFISDYIKDDNGNPYSLVNYCKLFNVQEVGPAHRPDIDAINLAHLYQAFLDNKDLVLKEYLKVLGKIRHLPTPVSTAIHSLASGEDFTSDNFINLVKEDIK